MSKLEFPEIFVRAGYEKAQIGQDVGASQRAHVEVGPAFAIRDDSVVDGRLALDLEPYLFGSFGQTSGDVASFDARGDRVGTNYYSGTEHRLGLGGRVGPSFRFGYLDQFTVGAGLESRVGFTLGDTPLSGGPFGLQRAGMESALGGYAKFSWEPKPGIALNLGGSLLGGRIREKYGGPSPDGHAHSHSARIAGVSLGTSVNFSKLFKPRGEGRSTEPVAKTPTQNALSLSWEAKSPDTSAVSSPSSSPIPREEAPDTKVSSHYLPEDYSPASLAQTSFAIFGSEEFPEAYHSRLADHRGGAFYLLEGLMQEAYAFDPQILPINIHTGLPIDDLVTERAPDHLQQLTPGYFKTLGEKAPDGRTVPIAFRAGSEVVTLDFNDLDSFKKLEVLISTRIFNHMIDAGVFSEASIQDVLSALEAQESPTTSSALPAAKPAPSTPSTRAAAPKTIPSPASTTDDGSAIPDW